MISIELLSSVLNLKIYTLKSVAQTSIIRFMFDAMGEKRDNSINIYELTHRCKEWAFHKGYEVVESEYMVRIKKKSSNSFSIYEASTETQSNGECFHPSTIFKACQKILNDIQLQHNTIQTTPLVL